MLDSPSKIDELLYKNEILMSSNRIKNTRKRKNYLLATIEAKRFFVEPIDTDSSFTKIKIMNSDEAIKDKDLDDKTNSFCLNTYNSVNLSTNINDIAVSGQSKTKVKEPNFKKKCLDHSKEQMDHNTILDKSIIQICIDKYQRDDVNAQTIKNKILNVSDKYRDLSSWRTKNRLTKTISLIKHQMLHQVIRKKD